MRYGEFILTTSVHHHYRFTSWRGTAREHRNIRSSSILCQVDRTLQTIWLVRHLNLTASRVDLWLSHGHSGLCRRSWLEERALRWRHAIRCSINHLWLSKDAHLARGIHGSYTHFHCLILSQSSALVVLRHFLRKWWIIIHNCLGSRSSHLSTIANSWHLLWRANSMRRLLVRCLEQHQLMITQLLLHLYLK